MKTLPEVIDVPDVNAQDSPAETSVPAAKRRGRPRGSASRKAVNLQANQETLHLFVLAASALVTEQLVLDPEIAPTLEELNTIFIPLERVLLRRIGTIKILSKATEDVQDIAASLIGVALYAIRAIQVQLAHNRQRRALQNHVPKRTEEHITDIPHSSSQSHFADFSRSITES